MSITYLRNTHDESGRYRGDNAFRNDEGKRFDQTQINYLGEHVFDSKVPMTADEYYERLCEMAAGGAYDTPPDEIRLDRALRDLALLIEYGVVKAVVPETMTFEHKTQVVAEYRKRLI